MPDFVLGSEYPVRAWKGPHIDPRFIHFAGIDLAKNRIFLSVKSAALFCAQAMACSDISQPMTRSPGKDCVKKPFPQPMSSTLA